MDTVQNISGVIVGGGPQSVQTNNSNNNGTGNNANNGSVVDGDGSNVSFGVDGSGIPELDATSAQSVGSVESINGVPVVVGSLNVNGVNHQNELLNLSRPRRSARQEFLSRPSWLFTNNENILFCTTLESLRYSDQNHVPRKFIEDWFADKMVTLDSKWPAGQRFLNETIAALKAQPAKRGCKQQQGVLARQKEFLNSRVQALKRMERAYEAAAPEQKAQVFKELRRAQDQAMVPLQQIEVQPPTIEEIALLELQTKIIRRIQGQTDRIYMAEQLAGQPYDEPNAAYFEKLQNEVLKDIDLKHSEIVASRDKVDPKSKQSRIRRRSQVVNGSTMSGSATRVRFTNREIAMLIHWIYTYPKSEWGQKIFQFYVDGELIRSPEHVRDKMRDLVTKSRDVARGGLESLRVRKAGMAKPSDPPEVQFLATADINQFRYPAGQLDYTPEGRYFDESSCTWVAGPLPPYYTHKYHDEIQRLRNVVRNKCMRKPEKQQQISAHTRQLQQQQHQLQQFQQQQHQQQHQPQQNQQAQLQQHYQKLMMDMGISSPAALLNSPETFQTDTDAQTHQSNGLQSFDLESLSKSGRKDYEIMASAALRQDFMQFSENVSDKGIQPSTDVSQQIPETQPEGANDQHQVDQLEMQNDLASNDAVEETQESNPAGTVEETPNVEETEVHNEDNIASEVLKPEDSYEVDSEEDKVKRQASDDKAIPSAKRTKSK